MTKISTNSINWKKGIVEENWDFQLSKILWQRFYVMKSKTFVHQVSLFFSLYSSLVPNQVISHSSRYLCPLPLYQQKFESNCFVHKLDYTTHWLWLFTMSTNVPLSPNSMDIGWYLYKIYSSTSIVYYNLRFKLNEFSSDTSLNRCINDIEIKKKYMQLDASLGLHSRIIFLLYSLSLEILVIF